MACATKSKPNPPTRVLTRVSNPTPKRAALESSGSSKRKTRGGEDTEGSQDEDADEDDSTGTSPPSKKSKSSSEETPVEPTNEMEGISDGNEGDINGFIPAPSPVTRKQVAAFIKALKTKPVPINAREWSLETAVLTSWLSSFESDPSYEKVSKKDMEIVQNLSCTRMRSVSFDTALFFGADRKKHTDKEVQGLDSTTPIRDSGASSSESAHDGVADSAPDIPSPPQEAKADNITDVDDEDAPKQPRNKGKSKKSIRYVVVDDEDREDSDIAEDQQPEQNADQKGDEDHRVSSQDWPLSQPIIEFTASSSKPSSKPQLAGIESSTKAREAASKAMSTRKDPYELPELDGARVWTRVQGDLRVLVDGWHPCDYYTGAVLTRLLALEATVGMKSLANLALTCPSTWGVLTTGKNRNLFIQKALNNSDVVANDAQHFYTLCGVSDAKTEPRQNSNQKNQQINGLPFTRSFHRLFAAVCKTISLQNRRFSDCTDVAVSTFSNGLSYSTYMTSQSGSPSSNGKRPGMASYSPTSSQSNSPSKNTTAKKRARPSTHGEFTWTEPTLAADAIIPVFDGTSLEEKFHLKDYQKLDLYDKPLRPNDAVLIVFTLGFYQNDNFREGPTLSFNVQDAIILASYDKHIPSPNEIGKDEPIFPVSLLPDVKEQIDSDTYRYNRTSMRRELLDRIGTYETEREEEETLDPNALNGTEFDDDVCI